MSNIRVLVLDDHEVVRRGICDILDRADGIEVVAEAGTVAQAVRRADAVRPDVVLSDLRLPDGTGLELIAHVRRTPVSYTHLRAHETKANLVCRLLLEKKKKKNRKTKIILI